MLRVRHALYLVLPMIACAMPRDVSAAEPTTFAALAKDFDGKIRPVLKQTCLTCHSTRKHKGELDLEVYARLEDFRRDPEIWQKIAEALDSGEMPPKESRQLSAADRTELRSWIRACLDAEAAANAGDPGAVVMRRLTNVEYNNSVRDLTGVDLQPAREFPADAAAGEGFTNVGDALVMSPSMLDKYLAAAKGIAAHAVFLPDGFRFSEKTTRPDWSEEVLTEIKKLYREYTDPRGSTRVNLQGLQWDTNSGGRIPLEKYLAATIEHRDASPTGKKSLAAIAAEDHLSPKYLQILWDFFTTPDHLPVTEAVRSRWREARPQDVRQLADEIRGWQGTLTRFKSVGHFKPWQEDVYPLAESQAFRIKLKPAPGAEDVVVSLVTRDAGDGSEHDHVVWQQPRLESPGRPPLMLRDLQSALRNLRAKRETLKDSACYLAAVDEARGVQGKLDPVQLGRRHGLDPQMLAAWLDYLGIVGPDTPVKVETHFKERLQSNGGYPFVKGWGSPQTPSIVANSSDREVRIPGIVKPRTVAVHPSPTQNVAVGWRSPMTGLAQIESRVAHVHPECGNGLTWSLELRRGGERRKLAGGVVDRGQAAKIDPIDKVMVRAGDFVSLLVGPRGDHSCDLTAVDLTIGESGGEGRRWSLSRDVTGDILAGNPHADALGHRDVWHFYQESLTGENPSSLESIPIGSRLDRWREASARGERDKLAGQIQQLLVQGPTTAPDHPDTRLYRQLTSLTGPLLGRLDLQALASKSTSTAAETSSPGKSSKVYGLPPDSFGKHPSGGKIDGASLVARAPSVMTIRVPAELAAGREFVVTAALDPQAGGEGSVQAQVLLDQSPTEVPLAVGAMPVLVREGSKARKRFERSFAEFRRVLPAALCYSQIVPVDEVVTLALYHREDDNLARLMLEEPERKKLDRLWDELEYVSQEAFKVEVGYVQFMEYTTQDSDPNLFKPLARPIAARAAALRRRLVDTEPKHLDTLFELAERAYRRPLTTSERSDLRTLYGRLRKQDLDHDAAFRLTLARVLVSPSFLYHAERSATGADPRPVSDWELASRLSYFLWSSMPDDELRRLTAEGKLSRPEVMAAQVRRMLKDEKARALATEFACQWLEIRGFDEHNEKSEQVFPEFPRLRGAMYEEAVQFFVDLFRRDGSVLDVLDADHTFLNEALAKLYGIPGVTGPDWRRVDGVKAQARGGILGMAAILAKQSGASRTSPILRGNWLLEMLLGEKLPKPPKNVPQLPESELDTGGLTVRQITEKHRSVESCAKCHNKIDPFGFALEKFDAIGRRRQADLAGRPIDTQVELKDGTKFADITGLREYLLTRRREEFLHQFYRKLLGYSLGRAVQLSDHPLLREIETSQQSKGYPIQDAILTIVQSPQFRLRRGLGSPLEQHAAHQAETRKDMP